MPLESGTRIGPYQILSAIGAGGMGEVYRARDTKLGRDVAIKVLPELFANDPERIARFQREAQVLAALNHPHIAAIFGLEDAGGITALAMELVEGDDLAQRLAKRPIPLDEALAIATQLAQALEAAHEQGVIHRDLKPANIKVRTDGTVKVLDFGLAKLTEAPGESPRSGTASMSPTLTSPVGVTGVGTILGTAAYMSPEQAKGRAVDKRCDIWAFGCVLYEMLSGRRPFSADDGSEVLAFVITKEPDWSALPASTPAPLRQLLRRCLEKEPRRRLRDIGDALHAIEEATVAEPAAAGMSSADGRGLRRLWIERGLAALLLTAACVTTGLIVSRARPPVATPITRFTIALPPDQQFTGTLGRALAFSPDGSQLAYVANNRIYVRAMADPEARPIAGTDDVTVRSRVNFAWSPDGRFIAYVAGNTLKRIPIAGGAPTTICSVAGPNDGVDPDSRGGFPSWSPAGIVYLGPDGIMRVSPDGGTPERIVAVDDRVEHVQDPQLLPDGRTLLFTVAKSSDRLSDRWDEADIVVQPVPTGARRTLIHGGTSAQYVPPGHLVYSVEGNLLAVPFDPVRVQITGPPVAVLEGVRRSLTTNVAQFSIADNGSLAYVPGPSGRAISRRYQLVTVGPKGEITPLPVPEGPYEFPRVSPDGTQLAFDTDDGKDANVWVYSLSADTAMRRLTFAGRSRHPIWSRDGRWITFQSNREGDFGLFRQRADGIGAAERLTTAETGTAQVPQSWSPAGDYLLFTKNTGGVLNAWNGANNPGSNSVLFLWSQRARTAEPFAGVQTPNRAVNAEFSPDGSWVAYSAGFAPSAVYVRPFPATGAVYQVSKNDDGHHPWWSRDGRQLFYVPGPDGLTKVAINAGPPLSFGNPALLPRSNLMESPVAARNIDVGPDSAHLVGISRSSTTGAPGMQVVLNWTDELKRLAPAKR